MEAQGVEITEDVIRTARELVKADTFIVALISEQEYEIVPCCPHCDGDNSVCIDENMDLSRHLAEMHLCGECGQIYIVCCFPTLTESAAPVFLQFTLKTGENAVAEVVASDMARAMMAQVQADKVEAKN